MPNINAIEKKSILICSNQGMIGYLTTVLRFLDHGLDVVADANEYFALLETKEADRYLAVFWHMTEEEFEQRSFVDRLASLTKPPPVFKVFSIDEKGEQRDETLLHPAGPILDFLKLPTYYEALMSLLNKARSYHDKQRLGTLSRRPVELFRSLSGNSRAACATNEKIARMADTDTAILVLGEQGTSKEVVARKIHYHSHRRTGPFVAINCCAHPTDSLEGLLFGNEGHTQMGCFEQADGGTLFLDEIDSLALPLQMRLLRVLHDGTIPRQGGAEPIRCNPRLVVATSHDIEAAVAAKQFREDLYYRLSAFLIEIAPLRERIGDIPLLVSDLITRVEKEKRGSIRLTSTAVTALTLYPWYGNERELADLVEWLAEHHPFGVVDIHDLPKKYRQGDLMNQPLQRDAAPSGTILGDQPLSPRLPAEDIDLKSYLGDIEANLIRQALQESEGVVAHAAKRLHLRRTTLVEKLKRHGMQRELDLHQAPSS